MFSQLSNTHQKANLRFRNLQEKIQKAAIVLVQVTNNLLQDKGETKAMIKNNLDATFLMGHCLQDISTMRCQKLKPFLNQACASLFDLEYTYTQQLFWEDINKSFQKYLKFIWKVIQYQFCVLPNWLSPCCRWFTKILCKNGLQELKHDISACIDDTHLQGNTETESISNIFATFKKLRSLCFTIHAGSSNLIPTQKLDILGFRIDSVATVSLKALSNLNSKTLTKTFINTRKLSQVIGKIVTTLPGLMYGALYYRHIELNKQHGL